MHVREERIANRQASVCLNFSQKIIESSKSYPADKSLSQLFRQHKELGSRDRRLIQQVIFAMFRWWGWVQHWEHSDWETVLLLAYLLDENPWNSVCDVLNKKGCFSSLPEEGAIKGNLFEKQKWLSSYVHIDISEFSIKQLVPEYFLGSLQIPEDTQSKTFEISLLESLQHRSPLWIRIQNPKPEKLLEEFQKQQVVAIPHQLVSDAMELQGKININNIKQFKNGAFEVQDLASQCIGLVCSPQSGEYWWDACAGGGGKSLHLASLMKGRGRVFSTEIRESKLKEIRLRAQRGKFNNIQASHWDGQKISVKEQFDGVLVDVPCSGTGTWRRNPDIRWKLNLDAIQEYAELQLKILEQVKSRVKSNGVLVYSTCSLIRMENEEVVIRFLEKNSDFILDPIIHPMTGGQTSGIITFWPHWFNSDGMFVARMKRTQ